MSELQNKPGNIVLIGFMGSGKTSVAKELRHQTGKDIIELDDEIVRLRRMSISDIFEKYGEESFRGTETSVLTLLDTQKDIILSCGGGTVLRKKNISLMKKIGPVIYLTASPQTILSRVRSSDARPILNGHMTLEHIHNLIEERQNAYLSAADVIISTDNKTLPVIGYEILQNIK